MDKYALIVAGGKGLRMGSEIPKQFLPLNGMPILMHTLKAFRSIPDIHLVLVLPEDQMPFWKKLCEKYDFVLPHQLVAGGKTRFESVYNGLQALGNAIGLVAIHDGVRPLVSMKVIEESYRVAGEKGNALTVVPVKDSLRKQELLTNFGVNRANYYLVQTPQTFQIERILAAYKNATHDNFTDDASVLEEAGEKINLIEGDYRNIKITTPEDMLFAEALLK